MRYLWSQRKLMRKSQRKLDNDTPERRLRLLARLDERLRWLATSPTTFARAATD
jgi:hypothetical protein